MYLYPAQCDGDYKHSKPHNPHTVLTVLGNPVLTLSCLLSGQGAEPDEDTKNFIADCMDGRAELETQEPDCTPLHVAIAERNYQAANVLIKAGADVNARDHFGMTSLHYAVREESREMCQILIEHGADVKAKDSDEHTAEDVAKVKDAGELVSLLGALAAN